MSVFSLGLKIEYCLFNFFHSMSLLLKLSSMAMTKGMVAGLPSLNSAPGWQGPRDESMEVFTPVILCQFTLVLGFFARSVMHERRSHLKSLNRTQKRKVPQK